MSVRSRHTTRKFSPAFVASNVTVAYADGGEETVGMYVREWKLFVPVLCRVSSNHPQTF